MPAHGPPAVPSRNALRVLRKLALAGSTVGSFCTVAAITYDVHRRVSVAERIVENKRALQTSAPRYDATSSARRLSRMMEAAEAGDFLSFGAWKEEERKLHNSQPHYGANPPLNETLHASPQNSAESPTEFGPTSNISISHEDSELATKPETQSRPKPKEWSNLPPSRPTLPSLQAKYLVRPPDPILETSTLESSLGISPRKQMTLEERMKELFERRQYIDAAQIFLDEHPATQKGISSERREQVMQAFYLNCRHDNVFIARSLFERLDEVNRVSLTMWKVLILSLAKKGCVESAATVFVRFRDTFQVPAILLDVVLRCLLESRRLTTAKWLLLKNLSKDRDCGLSGAYLTGLWKKTRSIELLNGQFTKLLQLLRRLNKPPTEKLVNPMIKAYVDYGRFSDAEALVHEMTTTYLVPLSCRTKGLLVYGKALQCDWVAVDEGLEEMRQLGLTEMKQDFIQIFDRIFLEYWVSHTADEIRNFLYHNIDKFDITPDKVLYKHILEAVVEKGDAAMISEFTDVARQRGWKVNVNEDEFLEMLRRRRSALEDSPVGFWQMLHAARGGGIRATASQQILGYDRRSFPFTEQKPVDTGEIPETWYTRTVDELTEPSRPVDNYQRLPNQMIHYMHVGKMAEALQCFKNAQNPQYHLRPHEIELALIATLLEHGLRRAQALLEDAWVDCLPLFFRQIKHAHPSAEANYMKIAIFRFYKLCWLRKSFIVKHHIIASTSRRLIDLRQPELALDMLVSVYMSRYGRFKSFDGVCMKMFIRAFAATNNLAGVRWCILTAISRDSALSQDFVVEVHRVLGVVRRGDAANDGMPRTQKPSRLMADRLKYLGFAAGVLTKKCEGNLEYAELRGQPAAKESYRRKLQVPLDEDALWQQGKREFQQMIEEWDEEYELERVLHRINNNKNSILAQWNEAKCLGQEWEEP